MANCINCNEINDIIAAGGFSHCTPEMVHQLNAMLQWLYDQLNCAQDVTGCIAEITDLELPTNQFNGYGWPSGMPSRFVCPILYVIQGCRVFWRVNRPNCDWLEWCATCGSEETGGNSVADQAVIYTAVVSGTPVTPAGQWLQRAVPLATKYNDLGTAVVVAGNTFKLTTGDYYIDWRTNTLATGKYSVDNISMAAQSRLFNITTGVVEDLGSQSRFSHPAHNWLHSFGACKVSISGEQLFRLETRWTGALDLLDAGVSQDRDEIIIRKVA